MRNAHCPIFGRRAIANPHHFFVPIPSRAQKNGATGSEQHPRLMKMLPEGAILGRKKRLIPPIVTGMESAIIGIRVLAALRFFFSLMATDRSHHSSRLNQQIHTIFFVFRGDSHGNDRRRRLEDGER
ncbi:hypothetical protein ACFS07_11915 [Undibacterium arcticum]